MKPAPFAYHAPRTVDEAVGLLAGLENARVLAGGQSLVPMLNMRAAAIDHLVDLNRIAGLGGIAVESGGLAIGAMTRQREVERAPEVRRGWPLLAEALGHVGHFQTRNRGTFGGSLCHLDPAAELPGVCLAYDAELTLSGRRGERSLPIAEWPVFSMTPRLEADEVLTRIRLPAWPERHGHAFLELARRHGDFALAGVGCLVALDGAGRIVRAAVALVGVGPVALRLTAAERALVGESPGPELSRAAASACEPLEAMSDTQASGAYRRTVAGVLTRRALELATRRAAALNA